MLIGLTMLAAAAQLASVQPVPTTTAPAEPEQLDERCLAAFALLGARPGEAGQAGRTGSNFFYGRLVGRRPGLDLGGALRRGVGQVAGHLDAELARCGGELSAAARAMQAAKATLAGGAPPAPAPSPAP